MTRFQVYGDMRVQVKFEIDAANPEEAVKLIEERECGTFDSIDAITDSEGYLYEHA